MSTEEKQGTEYAITAESLAIWPEIVGKRIERE